MIGTRKTQIKRISKAKRRNNSADGSWLFPLSAHRITFVRKSDSQTHRALPVTEKAQNLQPRRPPERLSNMMVPSPNHAFRCLLLLFPLRPWYSARQGNVYRQLTASKRCLVTAQRNLANVPTVVPQKYRRHDRYDPRKGALKSCLLPPLLCMTAAIPFADVSVERPYPFHHHSFQGVSEIWIASVISHSLFAHLPRCAIKFSGKPEGKGK